MRNYWMSYFCEKGYPNLRKNSRFLSYIFPTGEILHSSSPSKWSFKQNFIESWWINKCGGIYLCIWGGANKSDGSVTWWCYSRSCFCYRWYSKQWPRRSQLLFRDMSKVQKGTFCFFFFTLILWGSTKPLRSEMWNATKCSKGTPKSFEAIFISLRSMTV